MALLLLDYRPLHFQEAGAEVLTSSLVCVQSEANTQGLLIPDLDLAAAEGSREG